MTDLRIMHKVIHLNTSPVLFDKPFSAASMTEDWEAKNAEWWVADGALWGRNAHAAAGCILSRGTFPGNVLLDFYAMTVAPSTHDIDAFWNASWDAATNTRGTAYVAGVQGWWTGKIGIERSPTCIPTVAAPCPWFMPGREYHLQMGTIDGHSFIFVDGTLQLELLDTDPINSQQHTHIGFEAYQSQVCIRLLTVRQIAWSPVEEAYRPEF